ncbi:hypothetical protein D1007_45547 [Hordeum vulgare]|nr:hypothetical protein D1007_45547 [Hordeum vulgare]
MRDLPSRVGESEVQIMDAALTSSSADKAGLASSRSPGARASWGPQHRRRSRTAPARLVLCHLDHLEQEPQGQDFNIGVDGLSSQSLCKADVKPWLFPKKKSSKSLNVDDDKVDIFWDLLAVTLGVGLEPLEGFYVVQVFDLELALQVDYMKDAYSKTDANR